MASEIGMVEKLKEYFGSREDICFAFLFGSHVLGKTFQESDVDIAIYFKEGYSFEPTKKIWGELEEILGKDVDLVVLNTAPPLIGYTAIRGKAVAIMITVCIWIICSASLKKQRIFESLLWICGG